MSKKLITFIDHIGRTILGEDVSETGSVKLHVKNPAIIHVSPTQQGQLNVQTIPLYFREFIGEKSREKGTVWLFNYNSIVLGDEIDNDPRLIDQYDKLFGPIAPTPVVAEEVTDPKVIKLFE